MIKGVFIKSQKMIVTGEPLLMAR